MDRICYYIHTVDTGRAPSVDGGLLTLAICKPEIRRTADVGAWIIGFAPRALGWKLSYLAKVKAKLNGSQYYGSEEYKKRSDTISETRSFGGFSLRDHLVHDEGNIAADVGTSEDGWQNAWVLVSKRFWYFGSNAVDLSWTEFPEPFAKLQRLTQGHRVNHTPKLRAELEKILTSIGKNHSPGVHGPPRDSCQIEQQGSTLH